MNNIYTSLQTLRSNGRVVCERLKVFKAEQTRPRRIRKTCHTEAEVRNFFCHNRQRIFKSIRTVDEREFACGLNAYRKQLKSAEDIVKNNGKELSSFALGVLHARIS